MFTYRIGSIFVVCELTNGENASWFMVVYHVGRCGAFTNLGQLHRTYGRDHAPDEPLKHFRALKAKIRARIAARSKIHRSCKTLPHGC